jgi:hypothetical protein
VTRRTSTLLLLSIAGLVAGCNSTDGLHARGPWGASDLHRNYPQHSSPWGRRVSDEQAVIISGSGSLLNAAAFESGGAYLTRPQPSSYENGLPADPQPHAVAIVPASPGAPLITEDVPVPTKDVEPQPVPRALTPAASPPGVFTAPRRATSYAGTWKVTDGRGGSCTVHLSSVSSLDLYKASTSKCTNESLRNVNMWRFEENRISLFSRGSEVAHLDGSEASLSGKLTGSGAPIKMQR